MDVIEAIESSNDPAVTAGEIAKELGFTNRAILNRLEELEADGVVVSKKVGARATVWWLKGHSDARLRPSAVNQ